MRAGRLRHRFHLQDLSESKVGGTVSRSWSTVDTIRGSLEPLRGRERYDAAQVEFECDTRIRLRYRDDVTADMRLQHTETDDVYNIEAVIDVGGRRRELEVLTIREGA